MATFRNSNKIRGWAKRLTLSSLLLLIAPSSGCIIVPEGDYEVQVEGPGHSHQPHEEVTWVEVSCWAAGAQASSSSSYIYPEDFGPIQATGAPDSQDWNFPTCIDSTLAWAPAFQDGGFEFLDLVFDTEIRIDKLRIFENLGAGSLEMVNFANAFYPGTPQIEYFIPYSLQGGSQPCSVLSLDIDDIGGQEWTEYGYDTVMLEFDTTLSYGWNEIDAVQLIGLFDTRLGPLPSSCEYL